MSEDPTTPDARVCVTNALRLIEAVRDVDRLRIGVLVADIDRDELERLAVTLAAMLPGDVHPPTALAWIDFSPQFWPTATLVAECRRYDDGDRDTAACAAAAEVSRLAAQSEARHAAWARAQRKAVA